MGLSRFPHGISSFGVPIHGDAFVPFVGDTYFVKKAADSDYTTFRDRYNQVTRGGQYSVCTTADEAFARAGKGDRIIFTTPDSGGHDLTCTITIGSSQFGLKVYGDGNTMFNQRTTIKNPTAAADNTMFIVKTDKVEFAGLCFQNRKAGACIQIGDAAGQAYYNVYIHDCNFTDYGGVATYGITPGAVAGADTDQADPVNLVVERCYFNGFVTAAIKSNGTSDAYIDNYIKVAAEGNGIHLFKHTDSRGGGLYRGNYMIGPADATTMGILVTDIGSAAFANNITDNYFVGFTTAAVPITKQTNLQGGGNWYSDANGQWVYCDIVA
jgi:hypothetical protein